MPPRMDPQGEATAAAVFDFLCLYEEDEAAGRVRSLGEYLRRFPRHEVAVAEEFLRLQGGGGEAPAEAQAAEAGAGRMGPYRLLEELGKGGQGSVWVAEDTRIRRTVALKLLAGAFITDHRRARLRREAEALAALAHPGICPVLDADVEADAPWIAMPVLEGHDLGHALEAARSGGSAREGRGPVLLPRTRAELHGLLRFFEAAARAVHAAHEAGVVHRDLKPGNLFVHEEGRPVLLDFGLATDGSGLGETLTQSGDVFGTPAYMAPEQHDGRVGSVGPASDVFALGVTLHEALTGARPFTGTSLLEIQQGILHAPTPDPRAACPAAGEDLVAVLQVALEKDPARRYPTALALAEDLRRICDFEPVRARPAGPALRLRRWARRNPGIASGLAATFLVLSVALAVTLDLLAEVRAALDLSRGRALVGRVAELVPDRPAAAVGLALEALELAPGPAARSALLEPLLEDRLARTLRLPSGTKLLALVPVRAGDGEDWVTLDRDGRLRRSRPGGETVDLGPLPPGVVLGERTRLAVCGEVLLLADPVAGLLGIGAPGAVRSAGAPGAGPPPGALAFGPVLVEAAPSDLAALDADRCVVACADGRRVVVAARTGEVLEEWPRGAPGPVTVTGQPGALLALVEGPEAGDGGLERLGPAEAQGQERLAAPVRAACAVMGAPLWLDEGGRLCGVEGPLAGAPLADGGLRGLAAADGLVLAWSQERAFIGRALKDRLPTRSGESEPSGSSPLAWAEVDLAGAAPRSGSVAHGGGRAALQLADGSLLLLAPSGNVTGRARDFVRPAFLTWSLDGREVIAASAFEMAFAYAAHRPSGCFDVEASAAADAAFAPGGDFAWLLGEGEVSVVETPRGHAGWGSEAADSGTAPTAEPGALRWRRAIPATHLVSSEDGTRALAWGASGAWLLESGEGRVLASFEGTLAQAALDPGGAVLALVEPSGRVLVAREDASGRFGAPRALELPEPVELAEFGGGEELLLAQAQGPHAWLLGAGAEALTRLEVPSLDGQPGTRSLLRLDGALVLHGNDHHLRRLDSSGGSLAADGRRILRADWVRERGGVLVTARRGPAASLRVLREGQELRDADQPAVPHGSPLSSLDLSADGRFAVTSDAGGGVVLWSTEDGSVRVLLDGTPTAGGAAAWLDPSPGPLRWLMARGGRVSIVPADLEAVARTRPGRPLASWERGQFELDPR